MVDVRALWDNNRRVWVTLICIISCFLGVIFIDPHSWNSVVTSGLLRIQDNKDLHWDRSYIPVNCTYDDSVGVGHLKLYYQARNEFNNRTGIQLLNKCTSWVNPADLPEFLFARLLLRVEDIPKQREDRINKKIIIETNIPWIHSGGWTLLFSRVEEPTVIVTASMWMHPAYASSYTAWLHELGHVLGMQHSDVRDSIMWPKIEERAGKLSDTDLKWLKKTYK